MTVFLGIAVMGLILFGAVLADLSRISAGRALVKKAVDSAARSALAEYGSKLSREYGLFALGEKDGSALEKEVERYVSMNLTIPLEDGEYGNRLDLYGFRVERIEVAPLYNLSENDVFRRGVLEYMKYRAPKELAEGFLDRLAIFRQTGKMSEAYKKKVGVDKILGRMDKSQQALKKKVDGDGAAGNLFVNGFNAGGALTEAFNRFSSLYEGLDSLKKSIAGVEEQIARLRSSQEVDGSGEVGTGARLKELLDTRRSLAESLSDMQESLESCWNEIRYGLSGDYRAPNSDAAAEVGKIADAGKKAETELTALEKFLAENFTEEDSLSEDFVKTTAEEIRRLGELALSGKKAEEILSGLSANIDAIRAFTDRLDEIKAGIGASGDSTVISVLADGIGELTGKYGNIDYSYGKPEKTENTEDPRKGKKEEAERTLLDELTSDKNYLSEGIRQLGLPSFTKVESADFYAEDAPYLSGGVPAGTGAGREIYEAAYARDLSKVGENADLYDEEGTFEEDALDFIGSIGKIAAGSASKLRDNSYINEYIMGTFRNSAPVPDDGSENPGDKDFQGRLKSERDTFYEGEVEYILHGNPSEKANILMTRGQMLLVRFGLNTLHVYTDPKKKELAAGIAAGIAGWWTGGAGIPVLANLIMCGWGMGESVIDLKELSEGKAVPVYKLPGDWKLDVGLEKGGAKTDSRLYFSYRDYLRLFLLITGEDKKLDRMEDLIQLNLGGNDEGFRLSDCRTAVRVEAVVSMKYLFLGRAFMPASVRTEDGRHEFDILVYEGY